MEIELIFKIAAVGIIVSILNQVLSRSGRDEQATMTTLAGLVVVLMIVAQKISDLFELVKQNFADAGVTLEYKQDGNWELFFTAYDYDPTAVTPDEP